MYTFRCNYAASCSVDGDGTKDYTVHVDTNDTYLYNLLQDCILPLLKERQQMHEAKKALA